MKKALVTLIMDTGLVKLDQLNNFVVISKSRPVQKGMVPVHLYVFSSKFNKTKE